jgi:hypothetical protein
MKIKLIKLIRFLLASVLLVTCFWLYFLFRALELLDTNDKSLSNYLLNSTYECLTFKLPEGYRL